MRLNVIIAGFMSDFKTFTRSKGTLFWTLAFPIMLILIFGAIFSGADEAEYELVVIDYDDTDTSMMFINALDGTSIIKVKNLTIEKDKISSYIKDNNIKRLLVINEGFEQSIGMVKSGIDVNATTNLSFYFDQSEQTTNSVVRSVLSSFAIEWSMNSFGAKHVINIDDFETLSGEFNFIDFFLPGMIGFTTMQTCIYGTLERNTKFRKDGILRKLLTTPVTRTEWIFSKMLFQLFLSFVSTILIILIGIGAFGLNININLLMVLLIIGTSFLFTGLAMIIGRFVKDEESAAMAGGAISFPMMFLAGTFFPLEQMPGFLQAFAKILPLYYVNEGLRDAMITVKTDTALINTGVVIGLAVVLFIIGLLLTKWKED